MVTLFYIRYIKTTGLVLLLVSSFACTHKSTNPHYKWESIGNGLNTLAYNLAVFKDELYVCGDFNKAGDVDADLIARWDGKRWASLGKGVKPLSDEDMESSIIAMQVFDGKLWVSGTFDSAGNIPAHSVARWDGTSWDTA